MERAAAYIRTQPSRHFEQGEILIYQDEAPSKLFALRSGFVKVHSISESGDERIVWMAKKYDFIPLDLLFDKAPTSSYFYTAFTDLDAFVVDRQDFMDFVRDDQDALLGIVESLAEKYTGLLKHLNALQQSKAKGKLLQTLEFIASRFNESEYGDKYDLTLPLTHQDIANLAGISRETASVELKLLKEQSLIDYTPSSFVVYTDKIAALH